MNSMILLYIATLKHLGLLTEEGAHELGKELANKILPSNPEDALKQVQDAVKAVEKRVNGSIKLEPWQSRLSVLEDRVKALESKAKK